MSTLAVDKPWRWSLCAALSTVLSFVGCGSQHPEVGSSSVAASASASAGALATPTVSTTYPDVTDDPPTIRDGDILVVKTTRAASGALELHLGKGRALLTVDGATSIVGSDPVHGALALEVLAKWLKVPVPVKTHSQPLEPVELTMMSLGNRENKVFFERGAEYAEMYINIPDEDHVELVPKDSDYAEALANIFADALRDGPAPQRTLQSDPNLETEEALFTQGRKVEPGDHEQICLSDGWLSFQSGNKGESVWRTVWGNAPQHVCDLPGAVDSQASGPRGAVVVVTDRNPRSGIISSASKATLWVVTEAGCHAIATPKELRIGPFTWPLISPSGTEIALIGGKDTQLYRFQVAGGTPSHVSVKADELLYAWDTDGLQLHDLGHHHRRFVGADLTDIDDPTSASPDGVYTAVLKADSLDAVDMKTKTIRTFKPSFRSDIRALSRAAEHGGQWIGGHGFILRGSPDLVLDLAKLKTRPLAVAATVVCASADGTHALLKREDGSLFEAK